MYWHAEPVKPSIHVHSPVVRSHVPISEHSTEVSCAVLSAEGAENHDLP